MTNIKLIHFIFVCQNMSNLKMDKGYIVISRYIPRVIIAIGILCWFAKTKHTKSFTTLGTK